MINNKLIVIMINEYNIYVILQNNLLDISTFTKREAAGGNTKHVALREKTSLKQLLKLTFCFRANSMPSGKDIANKLYGKIKFVTSFPDYKVKIVDSFADLHVQKVDNFADKPGKWKIVDSFPDFKVQIVNAFEDIKVKYVTSFPGVR